MSTVGSTTLFTVAAQHCSQLAAQHCSQLAAQHCSRLAAQHCSQWAAQHCSCLLTTCNRLWVFTRVAFANTLASGKNSNLKYCHEYFVGEWNWNCVHTHKKNILETIDIKFSLWSRSCRAVLRRLKASPVFFFSPFSPVCFFRDFDAFSFWNDKFIIHCSDFIWNTLKRQNITTPLFVLFELID